MPTELPASHFSLKLNGSPAAPEAMDAMLSCTVETTLNLPDMCLIRLHDEGFKWIDSPLFREGVPLVVEAGQEAATAKTLFQGEIVAVEMDLDARHMVTLSIRAYDRSHRLHRGRHTQTYVQMTDSDIVSKVGQEAGFTVKAAATTVIHDWIMQNNQTNWEFLQECAARCGYRLFVTDSNKLNFQPIDYSTESIPLDWGKDLVRFRPRLTTARQVSTVFVRGWDPKSKAAIVGQSRAAKGTPEVGLAQGAAAQGGRGGKTAFWRRDTSSGGLPGSHAAGSQYAGAVTVRRSGRAVCGGRGYGAGNDESQAGYMDQHQKYR